MESAKVSMLRRLFGTAEPDPREALRPLYAQVVAHARQPHWYVDGGVPDSINGRFEMVSAMLSLVLLRMEEDRNQAQAMAFLTEIFVADMDAQLREFGVGDMVVGKRVGKLMGAFGGRLGAYRDAFAGGEGDAALTEAVRRNLYADASPTAAQIAHLADRLRATSKRLAASDAGALVSGTATW
jgi:cytochrome b pre-mRNA-processing protein 3